MEAKSWRRASSHSCSFPAWCNWKAYVQNKSCYSPRLHRNKGNGWALSSLVSVLMLCVGTWKNVLLLRVGAGVLRNQAFRCSTLQRRPCAWVDSPQGNDWPIALIFFSPYITSISRHIFNAEVVEIALLIYYPAKFHLSIGCLSPTNKVAVRPHKRPACARAESVGGRVWSHPWIYYYETVEHRSSKIISSEVIVYNALLWLQMNQSPRCLPSQRISECDISDTPFQCLLPVYCDQFINLAFRPDCKIPDRIPHKCWKLRRWLCLSEYVAIGNLPDVIYRRKNSQTNKTRKSKSRSRKFRYNTTPSLWMTFALGPRTKFDHFRYHFFVGTHFEVIYTIGMSILECGMFSFTISSHQVKICQLNRAYITISRRTQ